YPDHANVDSFFFFDHPPPSDIYTLSLHDALPILLFLGEDASLSGEAASRSYLDLPGVQQDLVNEVAKAGKPMIAVLMAGRPRERDRKSTRLNSSHVAISYAVFCLKKKREEAVCCR